MKHKFVITLDDNFEGYQALVNEFTLVHNAVEVSCKDIQVEKHLRCIRCGKKLKTRLHKNVATEKFVGRNISKTLRNIYFKVYSLFTVNLLSTLLHFSIISIVKDNEVRKRGIDTVKNAHRRTPCLYSAY